MDVLGYFGTLVPVVAEQVIEVPTVVCPPCAARTVLVLRSWRNSWWKCRRQYPILLLYSGVWSRTLTFQPQVVEVLTVLLVFSQNWVQQRFRFLRTAFLSGLWSRTVFPSEERITERIVEQIVDSPFLVETFLLVEVFTVQALGQGFPAFSGPEHGHDAPRLSRRGRGIRWRSSRLCPRTEFNSSLSRSEFQASVHRTHLAHARSRAVWIH